jgi:dephospho-CoA kinase
MLKIGLTGGIACGKTTVSDLFAGYDVPIIDADVVAHALVQPGQRGLQGIVARFGDEILHSDGTLNRAKLRAIVFADAVQRRGLEHLLHPLIRQAMQQQLTDLPAETPYCVLSIPLLLETQQTDWVDRVLVVDCSEAQQRSRLALRSGLSAVEIEQMLAAQISRQARLAAAHDVIDNSGDIGALSVRVAQLHQGYVSGTFSTCSAVESQ